MAGHKNISLSGAGIRSVPRLSEVTVISATARFSAVLAIGTLLAACSGSNRVEGIVPGLVNTPPNPAILPQPLYEAQKHSGQQPLYEAQKRSGQTVKRDVKPQQAKQLPQQPPQAQVHQSANAEE